MRDLIKDTLPSMEEEKKALGASGFKLRTSRLRGCHSSHFATTTARYVTVNKGHYSTTVPMQQTPKPEAQDPNAEPPRLEQSAEL